MHCSPNNRKPVAAARIKVESPETPDISKGSIILKPRIRIAKNSGQCRGESDEPLIFLAETCLVAVTAIPRALRIIRSVAAAGFFAYFRGNFPCRRRTSRYFAGSALCHRWAYFLFSQDLPLVATKLRTSFARLAPLPPLGSMRLLRSPPRCGATHLSQGLPRWAGPRLVKTKIPTSLQLFFD